ncbi:unnamed protein product [Pleuronectes platessa]|uniref:Uncharacterized protein n=1 Tax=Pleuronectes platessa TaxID=8262 RepID=A0A9N7TZ53_PLEPL|nr:unnamed protein product [Pleuronectes platessa]
MPSAHPPQALSSQHACSDAPHRTAAAVCRDRLWRFNHFRYKQVGTTVNHRSCSPHKFTAGHHKHVAFLTTLNFDTNTQWG